MTTMLNRPAVAATGLFFEDEEQRETVMNHPERLEEVARARLATCLELGMSRVELSRMSGIPDAPLRRIVKGRFMTRDQARRILRVKPVLSDMVLMRLEWAHFRRVGWTIDETREHLMREYGWTREQLKNASRGAHAVDY